MTMRGSRALRRGLGLCCVLLGAGMLLTAFAGLVTGCADHFAYATDEAAHPAETGAMQPEAAGQAAAGPDEAVSSEEAGDGPDSPTPPPASAAGAVQQHSTGSGPRLRMRGNGKDARELAAPDASPADAPGGAAMEQAAGQAAPQPQSGSGRDGFSALEQGWPASEDNVMDGNTADAEQQLAPNTPLSDEARGFAGRWVAAVINKDGAARLLASEDEWVFNLGVDARCSARQKLDGRYWEQSGWWQLQGDTLTLSLGPGGVWVFGLQREGGDIAVWSRAVEDAGGAQFTLFCVRTPEGRMPPGVAGKYNSDFGPLRFEPSGPGHWRASYGDPLGKLSVARVGGFLAGKWEQQPGLGFVLFRLNTAAATGQNKGGPGAASAIDGVWWYAGSTAFDGKWSATQAK